MKDKKQFIKWALQVGAVPILLGILGVLLLMTAFSLPSYRIRAHVYESVNLLTKEGTYYRFAFRDMCSTLDNVTEATYLNQALVGTDMESALSCALSGYRLSASSAEPIENLAAVFDDWESASIFAGLKRFFNGYEAVIRPLLMMTDYHGIRQINLYVMLFISLLLCRLMSKRRLGDYILPLIVSVLLIHPLVIAYNMTFMGFYLCMVVPSIIFLLMPREELQKKAHLLFAAIGAVTFYFNMNYFQLLCFAMPFMFFVLLVGIPKDIQGTARMFAGAFIPWFVGFAGMMVFKWILYAILIDPAIFRQMLNNILMRTGLDYGPRSYAVRKNIQTALSNRKWLLSETVFVLYSVFMWWKNKGKLHMNSSSILLFLIMLLVPVLRYALFANHVIIHSFVMYRILMMPVLALNFLITEAWHEKESVGI